MEELTNTYLAEHNFEDLKDYEGIYKISENGEVWSIVANKMLKPQDKQGYLWFSLVKDKIKRKCYIHRLLALQYIENPNNYPEVDHIDRDRTNNSLDNLRWADKHIQNNNKCNCIALKTEEEQKERIEDIKEYKRKWAEEKRRKEGIPVREKVKTLDVNEYKNEWRRNKKAKMTEAEKEIELEKRRARYARSEKTDEQKEKAKERARKQREAVKADTEKWKALQEYKKQKAKEYKEKKENSI